MMLGNGNYVMGPLSSLGFQMSWGGGKWLDKKRSDNIG